MLDGTPLPPMKDFPPENPVVTWLSLLILFWIVFGLVLFLLPRRWSDAVIQAAFPFLPPKGDRNAD